MYCSSGNFAKLILLTVCMFDHYLAIMAYWCYNATLTSSKPSIVSQQKCDYFIVLSLISLIS